MVNKFLFLCLTFGSAGIVAFAEPGDEVVSSGQHQVVLPQLQVTSDQGSADLLTEEVSASNPEIFQQGLPPEISIIYALFARASCGAWTPRGIDRPPIS